MTLRLIICVLAATAALAQTSNKPTLKTPAERSASHDDQTTPTLQKRDQPASEVPLDQPVITIQGLCPATTNPATNAAVPSTKECSVVMTREQFGNLVKSFNTNNQQVSIADRRKLAESYVDILVYSEAAKSAGVENSPAFIEIMRVLRLKTLADLYLNGLAEQFRNPTQAEIEAYYQANQAKFESAKLGRIYIPKSSPDVQAPLEQKNAYPQKASAVADDMQARAAKGEPIDKLQKEAYATLGINVTPPNTEMNVPRHGVLPPKLEQAVFSHNAGDVFRGDDANGFIIYHVDQKAPAPLETVKEEVSRDMVRSRMDEKIKELKAPVHTTLEEKYFGAAGGTTPAPTQPGQTAPPK
jgi:PPIC-type PPIASE domain